VVELKPTQSNYFLCLNGIEHSGTKVWHPQKKGSTERLNQITQNEFYKVAHRKKVYTYKEEAQKNLYDYLKYYNNEKTNQGKHCQSKTPIQTFQDERPLYQKYDFENSEEEQTVA
jgi:hypothetical protein